jgi:DNA polymerase III subunit epsilon
LSTLPRPAINPAIARAQHLRRVALVLDTETTGSNRTHDEVIELGVVRASNGEVLINQRFRPTKNIEPGAFKVHGISERHLIGEPRFDSKWEDYYALLNNQIVIGWNVKYDQQMLETTCRKYNLDVPRIEWVDLMPLYRDFRRAAKICKLSVACDEMKVIAGDHSAKSDALATARVLHRMAGKEEAPEVAQQEELFDAVVTHEWELAEVSDYYNEEPEEEETESPKVIAEHPTGTAEAYLRDGSICIPMDARPVLRWWLPGSQSLFVTLAEMNAPLASWRKHGKRERNLWANTHANHCKGVVQQGDGFRFCAQCGRWWRRCRERRAD